MTSAALSPRHVEQLRKAHATLGDVLGDIGALDLPSAPESKRIEMERKMWPLLKAVELAGGDLSLAEWRQLGIDHGYDPRGLGGFFTGYSTMESDGDRRRLTEPGRRWVQRMEPEFGPYKAP